MGKVFLFHVHRKMVFLEKLKGKDADWGQISLSSAHLARCLTMLWHKKAFVSINLNYLWLYWIQRSLMHREDFARKDCACVSFHFLSRKMKELFSFIFITFIQQTNFNKKKRALWHWDEFCIFIWQNFMAVKFEIFQIFHCPDSDVRLRCLRVQTVSAGALLILV